MNTAPSSAERRELLDLAHLVKRTLQHQQRYFKASQQQKPALLRECRDLERRLNEAADKAIERSHQTASMFDAEGGPDATESVA